MGIISNDSVKSLLKTVYLSGVANSKFQNSPVLSNIIGKKPWFGGEEIKYATQYGNGSNFGENYRKLIETGDRGAQNAEWVMQQGETHGMFYIDLPEQLVTSDERGAYMSALENKMAACFDGMSKRLATYLYGGSYGIVDRVGDDFANVTGTSFWLTLTAAGARKLDIGTMVYITNDKKFDGAAFTAKVQKKYGTKIQFAKVGAPFAGSSETVSAVKGSFIELWGQERNKYGYDSKSSQTIEGLPDIIPHFYDRTGGDWDGYIAKKFRGIDRDVAVDNLCGAFVKGATGKRLDAIEELLSRVSVGGAINPIMIMNHETALKVSKEIRAGSNGGTYIINEASTSTSYSHGFQKILVHFGMNTSQLVLDPYCPEDVVYAIDKNDLDFYDLGNVGRVIAPVANDEIGKHEIEGVGSQGLGDSIPSALNIDKLFTIVPGAAGDHGETMRISANVFGNFLIRKTSSVGVAVLN